MSALSRHVEDYLRLRRALLLRGFSSASALILFFLCECSKGDCEK